MEHPQQSRPADLLACLAGGVSTGDAADDAACAALLATGMTLSAIVAVLAELARVRPRARIA